MAVEDPLRAAAAARAKAVRRLNEVVSQRRRLNRQEAAVTPRKPRLKAVDKGEAAR